MNIFGVVLCFRMTFKYILVVKHTFLIYCQLVAPKYIFLRNNRCMYVNICICILRIRLIHRFHKKHCFTKQDITEPNMMLVATLNHEKLKTIDSYKNSVVILPIVFTCYIERQFDCHKTFCLMELYVNHLVERMQF